MNDHDLRAIRRYLTAGTRCHGIVYRDGEMDACDKAAVAIVDGRESEDEGYWPACAYHANRYGRGRCVPLFVVCTASSLAANA